MNALLELAGKIGLFILDIAVKDYAKKQELKLRFLKMIKAKDDTESMKVYKGYQSTIKQIEDEDKQPKP